MKIIDYRSIDPEPVKMEGAKDVTIRWLVTREDGAPNFAMRLFEVAPGGCTPLHVHEHEHEVYILEGEGTVWREGEEVSAGSGTAVFVPPGEKHQFVNRGSSVLKFLCFVPHTE